MQTRDFGHYWGFEEMVQALESWSHAYPDLCTLCSIGKSGEDRDIWAMILTNSKTGPHEDKAAFLIDGNHHAGEVTGSMISLYIIDHLLEHYGKDQNVTRILDRFAVYVIPRLSPDGAEVFLTTPESLRSAPRFYPDPNPEDKEGLHPADLDGDGDICLMRVVDPAGEWKVSSKDPRMMVRREPDEEDGTFYRVYTEGLIKDYEGGEVRVLPSKWGLDFNRNYPHGWALPSKQPGAGAYPLSEPETRSIADFVVNHPNIALAFTYHTTGGVILRVPGSHPASKSPPGDINALIAIGEMGTKETGYPCIPCFEDFSGGTAETALTGAFDDWFYEQQGILGYTVETWNLAQRSGVEMWPRRTKSRSDEEEDLAKIFAWNDRELAGRGWKDWSPYDHPQLGPVEIGGWRTKFVVVNAPPSFLVSECHKNTAFALRAMACLPRLEIVDCQVKNLVDGAYEVSVIVKNVGFLPTFGSHQARAVDKARELEAVLTGEGVHVVGKPKRLIGHLEGRSGETGGFGFAYFRASSSKRETRVAWVIRGEKGTKARVTVSAHKAGKVSRDVVLE